MTALYEITEQHRSLALLAEESDDMAQAVADTMESIEGDFQSKSLSLVSVMLNMDGDLSGIKDAIERLTKRKKSIENSQASMKAYLKTNMEATGINKISCPLFTITLAKGRDIVNIDDIEKIPTDYIEYKTTSNPMKRELLAALKEGEKIDGVSVVKSESSIRIK